MLDKKRFHYDCPFNQLLLWATSENRIKNILHYSRQFFFTKYDLTLTGEQTICGCGPRVIIVFK